VGDSLSGWLALREAADTAARDAATEALTSILPVLRAAVARTSAVDVPLRVVDLAAGTGNNFRYLAPRLGTHQEWLLVDHDETLLGEALGRISAWGATRGFHVAPAASRVVLRGDGLAASVETRVLDLNALNAPDIFASRHLVTASALLDLVSDSWLRKLAAHCRSQDAAALFTLSYNGRSDAVPREPEDDEVLTLFNQHQARDKGLGGPAAGPGAVDSAARAFAAVGYDVRRQQSDWVLGAGQGALQEQLIEGWADASSETSPARAEQIRDWLRRRLAHVREGHSQVTVSHEDLAAWPVLARS
jgi:hypothetical protein